MRTTLLGKLDSLDQLMLWGIDSITANSLFQASKGINVTDSTGSLWVEVNDIALMKVLQLDTTYTTNDLNKLEAIGALCPTKYGPAVYKARDLLTAIDSRPRLFLHACEEIDVPQMPSLRRADPDVEEEENISNKGIEVFPNPSTGQLTVSIYYENEQQFSFSVTDLSGKVVHSGLVSIGLNQVHLTLTPGSYLYSVTDANGASLHKGNVVIIK